MLLRALLSFFLDPQNLMRFAHLNLYQSALLMKTKDASMQRYQLTHQQMAHVAYDHHDH